MNAYELLTALQQKGFTLTPLPEGKLAVKPAEKLTEALREDLRRYKPEVLRLLTRPYLTDKGELRIPFTADPKYHWWKGGQSITETLQELNAPADVWRRYVGAYTETKQ
jgi:hypothetical protein